MAKIPRFLPIDDARMFDTDHLFYYDNDYNTFSFTPMDVEHKVVRYDSEHDSVIEWYDCEDELVTLLKECKDQDATVVVVVRDGQTYIKARYVDGRIISKAIFDMS